MPADPEDPLTQMVREGVQPKDFAGRMKLAGDKLTGNAPLGVDASSKTMRKVIGGGGELLAVFKFGFIGGILLLLGVAMLYVGVDTGFDWKVIGVGAVMALVGAWALRYASQAWKNFRAISKA
jgi:hypothetical protein